MSEIKKIPIFTLEEDNPNYSNFEKTINFLSNELIYENDYRLYFKKKEIKEFKKLILIQYRDELIGKCVFKDVVDEITDDYIGYYIVEKGSIELFDDYVGTDDLKKYNLNKIDGNIEIKNLSDMNQMIEDYTFYNKNNFNIWSIDLGKDYVELMKLFKNNNCISIDYLIGDDLRNFGTFKNQYSLKNYLNKFPKDKKYIDIVRKFVHYIKIGDIILIHKNQRQIYGLGIVKSEYIYQYNDLKHFKRVNWVYNDEPIKFRKKDSLGEKTISLFNSSYDFNEILCNIAGNNDELRIKLLNFLFNQFYDDYYHTNEGKDHHETYGIEQENVISYWSKISENNSKHENANIIWYKIFNRNPSVLRDGTYTNNILKNLIQSGFRYPDGSGFTEEDMDDFAMEIFDTVNNILNSTDFNEQNEILAKYADENNIYKYNIGVGRFSPILFFLDGKSFYPINRKTVETVKLLSKVLKCKNIKGDLEYYIEDNKIYKDFLENLKLNISINCFDVNVKVFDEFCHWICDDKLGHYFDNAGKFVKILPIKKIFDIERDTMIKPFESSKKRNLIYFGAPGTGKSHQLDEDKRCLLGKFKENYERVTFHPDYSYANFVGTYKPVPNEKKDNEKEIISYEYVPGPFMRLLVKALEKPEEPFLLVIEEINRANAAAVFGEVFQLLDRKDAISKFPIHATEDMSRHLAKEFKEVKENESMKYYLNDLLGKDFDKITIPQNMFIWATMNSADQGVFPLDTAFKRRWDFKYFPINSDDDKIKNMYVEAQGWNLKEENNKLKWDLLRQKINEALLDNGVNEDKLIGPYFAFNQYLDKGFIPFDEFKEIFKNKILMYLYEDAARLKPDKLFDCGDEKITYSQICDDFEKIGIRVFRKPIWDKFVEDNNE